MVTVGIAESAKGSSMKKKIGVGIVLLALSACFFMFDWVNDTISTWREVFDTYTSPLSL